MYYFAEVFLVKTLPTTRMTKDEIKAEIKGVIEPYVMQKELLDNLSDEIQLIGDLKINSAHVVDIVLDIEEKYDITIDDESINKMNTIGEAIEVILEKMKKD